MNKLRLPIATGAVSFFLALGIGMQNLFYGAIIFIAGFASSVIIYYKK